MDKLRQTARDWQGRLCQRLKWRSFSVLDWMRKRLPKAGCWVADSIASRVAVTIDRQEIGEWGEWLAERYLRGQGMLIVARQLRTPLGELDVVAIDGQTIVFIEVKTRKSDVAGHALEAVTLEKQRQLTRLALAYMRRNHLLECPARFDVVAVTIDDPWLEPEIIHVPNAFEPTERYQLHA